MGQLHKDSTALGNPAWTTFSCESQRKTDICSSRGLRLRKLAFERFGHWQIGEQESEWTARLRFDDALQVNQAEVRLEWKRTEWTRMAPTRLSCQANAKK